MNNTELYGAVRVTISKLDKIGMGEAADRLRAAMTISSMPGEILGELRVALQNIERDKVDAEILYDVDCEITYIDSVSR
jgi:hypothetical protein